MPTGRFAPSPTGDLHLGNLRTALLAWVFARSAGSPFLVRFEDLDPGTVRPHYYDRQLEDLAAIGLTWDGPVVRQSERRGRYEDAIAQLERAGATYPCYCSRREILEAAHAPHGPSLDGAYPGTCRTLSATERAARERLGRRPALRVLAGGVIQGFVDGIHGPFEGVVDDVVIRRNDGTPAYNLAVMVDDVAQGVGEVVRGDDLLSSTPRQLHLANLLGLTPPQYTHVPLVLGPDGSRLAKRHGAVTLRDRLGALYPAGADVMAGRLMASAGLAETGEPLGRDALDRLAATFTKGALRRSAWVLAAHEAEAERTE